MHTAAEAIDSVTDYSSLLLLLLLHGVDNSPLLSLVTRAIISRYTPSPRSPALLTGDIIGCCNTLTSDIIHVYTCIPTSNRLIVRPCLYEAPLSIAHCSSVGPVCQSEPNFLRTKAVEDCYCRI